MRHRPARRLLPQLLDATLPRGVEAEVRRHAAGCRRCRRVLDELELCERLVARLPHGVFGWLDPAEGEPRLAGLASWAFPRPRRTQRWLAAEGVAAALLAGVLAGAGAFAGATSWLPSATTSGTGDLVQVACVTPGAAAR